MEGINMKYSIDAEKNGLFLQYQNLKTLYPAVSLLVENIDSLLKICAKPPFSRIGESILKAMVTEEDREMQALNLQITETGKQLNLEERATILQYNIKNI